MSQSYQAGMASGAAPNHPAQQPSVTADEGITEKANSRPDVASIKDTSNITDNKGDPNVPPNPSEVKAEIRQNDTKQQPAESKEVDPDVGEEGNVKPPPGVEYPEQKHAGKVGLGPAYAETHGAVSLSEKFIGLKQELKGKITRNPEAVEKGREIVSGEAKKKELEKEAAPMGSVAAPSTDKKSPSVAKGAEGDKPIAEAAAAEGDKKEDTGAPAPAAAKEAEQKTEEAKTSSTGDQPSDLSNSNSTGAEKAEERKPSVGISNSSGGSGDVHTSPPAEHQGASA